MLTNFPTIPRPLITVPQTDAPPAVDGRLDDPCWKWAARVEFLPRCADAEPAVDRTRALLTYDADRLYLAFTCFASGVARDDIVEDWRRHERVLFELCPTEGDASPIELRLDSSLGDGATVPDPRPSWWEDSCLLATTFGESSWSAEVAIPFRAMGVTPPPPGTTWRFNIKRIQKKRQEDTSVWCQRWVGDNWQADRAGDLVFGGPRACTVAVRDIGDRCPGNNVIRLDLVNPGSEAVVLRAAIEIDGEAQPGQVLTPPPRQAQAATIPYHVPDGAGVLTLTVTEAASSAVIARQGISLALPANRQTLAHLAAEHERLAREAPAVLRPAARELQRRRGELEDRAGAARSRGDALALAREVEALALATSKLAFRLRLDDPTVPCAAGVEIPMRSVFRDRPLPPTLTTGAELWACGNERESAQIVIVPFDQDIERAEVTASDLVGPTTISRDQVEIGVVGYVETQRARYRQPPLGAYPDPLLPNAPFDVAAGAVQPIWVTVSAPPDTPAGDYRGRITVTSRNAPPLAVPLTLHVWDFSLPRRFTLRTAMALFEAEFNRFYGWSGELPAALRRRHYDFFLLRRINPGCMYSTFPIPRREDVEYCLARGANAITLGYIQRDPRRQFAELKPYLDFLADKGALDLAYIYGFDEVTPEGFPGVRSAFSDVAAVAPGVKRAITIGVVADPEPLAGCVDIFIPETERYRPEHFRPRQQAGDQAWVYWSMWPRHPYANAFIDYPALDKRILFWQCWKYRLDGFNYYAINLWATNCTTDPDVQSDSRIPADPKVREAIRQGKRWPEIPWNTYAGDGAIMGDGHLVYPGPEGELLSSMRLENMSAGIQDYDMLALLDRLTARLRAADTEGRYADLVRRAEEILVVNPEVAKSFAEYARDPEVILRERRRAAEAIVAIKRLLPPDEEV